MKQKFLKDLGIDIDDATDNVLKQFDLNGFMDQISDNRLKEENKQFDKLVNQNEEKENEANQNEENQQEENKK